jgi:hypothetical protein
VAEVGQQTLCCDDCLNPPKDDSLIEKYNFFIFEVVKARVARSPKHPETLHYMGDGLFMVAGKIISRRGRFRPGML